MKLKLLLAIFLLFTALQSVGQLTLKADWYINGCRRANCQWMKPIETPDCFPGPRTGEAMLRHMRIWRMTHRSLSAKPIAQKQFKCNSLPDFLYDSENKAKSAIPVDELIERSQTKRGNVLFMGRCFWAPMKDVTARNRYFRQQKKINHLISEL